MEVYKDDKFNSIIELLYCNKDKISLISSSFLNLILLKSIYSIVILYFNASIIGFINDKFLDNNTLSNISICVNVLLYLITFLKESKL